MGNSLGGAFDNLSPAEQASLQNMINQAAEAIKPPPADEIPEQVEFVPPAVLRKQIEALTKRIERMEYMLNYSQEVINSRMYKPSYNPVYSTGTSLGGQIGSQSSTMQSATNTSSGISAPAFIPNKKKKYGFL
jgi:hypothetical protein